MFSLKALKSKFLPTKNDNNLDKTDQDKVDQYCDIKRPTKKELVINTNLIAVDFETTGLNPAKDEIISMGFCPINDDVIRLADCLHIVINTGANLTSENVAIHGLTDDILSKGMTPQQAFLKFIELTKNNVIIAHHHSIERTFFQKLAKTVTGKTVPLSFVDTYWFAKLRMQRRQQAIAPDSLRLFNLRKSQNLPNYKAHNALEDAISTAELYLAQKASLNLQKEKIRLKELGLFNYKT